MRKPLVVANWKMNGDFSSNLALLTQCHPSVKTANADIVVCPPHAYLLQVGVHCCEEHYYLGAQNVCAYSNGAYTGEISADMLLDLDCRFCLLGHSERRALFSETNQDIAQKFIQLKNNAITPILCIGETLEQREQGHADQVIIEQIDSIIDAVGIEQFKDTVIAYEPIWAIGTGLTATPEQAQSIHLSIRNHIKSYCANTASDLRILYGGSVKPDNAAELFSQADIDGGLVGGASLEAQSFIRIVEAF